MPNTVWSHVRMRGPYSALTAINRSNLLFQVLHPCPVEDEHWHDWRVAHWGCKWTARNVRIRECEDGSLSATFETPWQPPFGLLAYLTLTHPGLRVVLEFTEEFDETVGQIAFADGRMKGEYVRPTLCKPKALRAGATGRPWLNADVILSNTVAQGGDLEALDCMPELADTLPVTTVDMSYEEFVEMMETAVARVQT